MTSPADTHIDEPPPDEWPAEERPPDDDDPTDYKIVSAEPIVGVPAGLIGTSIELLDLCDELFNRPGSNALDARVAAVIRRYQNADVATLRWFHDGLGITAHRMHQLLDECGIVVEPELHGRHGLLYHP
jgi:hypothetical protein